MAPHQAPPKQTMVLIPSHPAPNPPKSSICFVYSPIFIVKLAWRYVGVTDTVPGSNTCSLQLLLPCKQVPPFKGTQIQTECGGWSDKLSGS